MSNIVSINQSTQKSVASTLSSSERKSLALRAFSNSQSITDLANEHNVSRKFLYQQTDIARQAIDNVFTSKQDDNKPLFMLPVTKEWLHQLVLSLTLSCHASMRGIIETFNDVLDSQISVGTIHNIITEAISFARKVQSTEDLSNIKIGAHDEIFQNSKPVLVGCDTESTYCYLLSLEEARDATTWGVHLLDLQEKGLKLNYSIADGAQGLRAAQAEVWSDTPCRADVFHVFRDLGQTSFYLENRALSVMSTSHKLEQKMQRLKKHSKGRSLSKKLASARTTEAASITIAEDISIISQWLQEDILSVVGPNMETRQFLFDWIIQELSSREPLAEHRIKPVRCKLQNARDNLLSFVADIDQQLFTLAQQFHVDINLVRSLFEAQGFTEQDKRHWQQEQLLYHTLGDKFYPIHQAISNIISSTVRASSVVENLNSRLRNYFFLRKQLGPEYLELLRFFLNHRRFMRNEHPQHQGLSPTEILTGKQHLPYLELLGFTRFKKAA